jgi:hypothetical protein
LARGFRSRGASVVALDRSLLAGLGDVQSFWYDVVYSHEDWRGRIRACNGVLALRDSVRIAAFDKALRERLVAEFPDPMTIPHRVFVISGTKPSV